MAIKYYKEAFDRIPEEKRARILKAATLEFASKGFRGANIRIIASSAEISVGVLYKYFASKEDIFLTVVDEGFSTLNNFLWKIIADEGDIFQKSEKILTMAINFSRQNPHLIQIYLNSTTESLSHRFSELYQKIEAAAAQFYPVLISSYRSKGLISQDVDESIAAFCIDSLIMVFQFSYACTYYKERMKLFAGRNVFKDDEHMVQGVLQFIRKALS